jgi:hypothetical protein
LRRRLSAPKRIGCVYRLTSLQAPSGFELSSWLPVDLLVGFISESERPGQALGIDADRSTVYPGRPKIEPDSACLAGDD